MPGRLDPELAQEWIFWRLVMEHVATLEELESHWSLDDVLKMNALLDMTAALNEQEAKRAESANRT